MDDDRDELRLQGIETPCPQCGYVLTAGLLGEGDPQMLISLVCLKCGYTAVVDPFA